MRGDASPNHDFMLATARRLSPSRSPRLLDFGCGAGHFVRKARAAGIDAYGADAYPGSYKDWYDNLGADLQEFISYAPDGLPYPDKSFDTVNSNFVFEHIERDTLQKCLADIWRVLRPEGVLIAAFPVHETWFEGHCGLYFAHWLRHWPAAQWHYLRCAHLLGFGYYRGEKGAAEWATEMQNVLSDVCYYHRISDIRTAVQDTFGVLPSNLGADFMRFRLPLAKLPNAVLEAICLWRAGFVMCVRKAKGE